MNIPAVDLIMSRDTLQHLSFEIIFDTLKNLAKTNAKWYIIGGYDEDNNINISNGEYFPFNISKKPFSIIPDSIVPENNEGHETKKFLFIFNGDNFRNQISKMKV